MKHSTKIIGAVACAVCLLAASGAQAWGGGRGHGDGGFRGGDGFRGWGGGHRGWGGWGFSFSYCGSPYYAAPYYYPYDYYYYYAPPVYYSPPPVVYRSQPAVVYNSPPAAPVVESSQQDTGDRPLSPTAVDRDSPPPPPAQQPPPIPRSNPVSVGVADIKALGKAGLSDDVMLSHIRGSQAAYHLTTAEIIDLKQSGVSEKVIDFMINTATASR